MFGDRLDHLLAVVLRLFAQLCRNFFNFELRSERLIAKDKCLHLHEIDDALELFFGSNGELQRNGILTELLPDLSNDA